MQALQFPCTIFKTQKQMDDDKTSDMRCGDLSESQLKAQFHLVDVSTRADPYTLTKITPFSQPQSMFHGSRGEGEKITRQQCADILFDEFRDLSRTFAIYSPYKELIGLMITHMQKANGAPFRHTLLDNALREHIVNDRTGSSSIVRLQLALRSNIDWRTKSYPSQKENELRKSLLRSKLPKFDRFQDNFNGMGISVHDTWATHITIKSLRIENNRYHAVVHYKIQDHFGLDNDDVSSVKFNQFRFFRIWFVLQRFNLFSFKPFMTNMESTVEIIGERNESDK